MNIYKKTKNRGGGCGGGGVQKRQIRILNYSCFLLSMFFNMVNFLQPEFNGDLVYKFRKIIGKNDFPYHFKKIIVRYKKIGYNIDVLRQTACLVVNPIKVNSFAYLFNCTTVGRASD